jgi:hypothetical protein
MDYAKILSGWKKSKFITHSGQRVFFACDGRRAAAFVRPGFSPSGRTDLSGEFSSRVEKKSIALRYFWL